jgi:hypothetical protein
VGRRHRGGGYAPGKFLGAGAHRSTGSTRGAEKRSARQCSSARRRMRGFPAMVRVRESCSFRRSAGFHFAAQRGWGHGGVPFCISAGVGAQRAGVVAVSCGRLEK